MAVEFEPAADTATEIMTAHFKAHPENKVEDIQQVTVALLGVEMPSEQRKTVVEAALKAADHPLKTSLKAVLETL